MSQDFPSIPKERFGSMIFRIRKLHFVNINVILCYVGEGELKCFIVIVGKQNNLP